MSSGRLFLGLACFFIPAFGLAAELPVPAIDVGHCVRESGGQCDCPACQANKAAELKKAVAAAYAPLFYNNNFSYLNNPAYDDWHLGERFKQIPVGDCWLVDLGG